MERENYTKRFKIWNKKIHIRFQQYKTIRSFGESIYNPKAIIVGAEKDQSFLLENLVEFNNKSRPKNKEG